MHDGSLSCRYGIKVIPSAMLPECTSVLTHRLSDLVSTFKGVAASRSNCCGQPATDLPVKKTTGAWPSAGESKVLIQRRSW